MVSNDILEYWRPKEVFNNYTSGYGVEVNPEIHEFDFTTKLSLYWESKIYNGLNTGSEY